MALESKDLGPEFWLQHAPDLVTHLASSSLSLQIGLNLPPQAIELCEVQMS